MSSSPTAGKPGATAYGELRYGWLYAGVQPWSVNLPTQPFGEVDLYGGIRPVWGSLTLDFGAIYQWKPNVALTGRFGINFDDFSQRGDTGSSLRLQIQYSPKRKLDLVGRMGFDRLDDAGDTFHLGGALAVRI